MNNKNYKIIIKYDDNILECSGLLSKVNGEIKKIISENYENVEITRLVIPNLTCLRCKNERDIEARGLCKPCYNIIRKQLHSGEIDELYPKIQIVPNINKVEKVKRDWESDKYKIKSYCIIHNKNLRRHGETAEVIGRGEDYLKLKFIDGFKGNYDLSEIKPLGKIALKKLEENNETK